MSAIGAVFAAGGRPADGAAVQAMLNAMPYRGPDGARTFVAGPAALGCGALDVIGEVARAGQPLVSPRTGCAVVADVRLDNREDLRRRLPLDLPDETSDAALILRAYETWGPAAAGRLLGDFAFVVFDPRRRRLVCARDTSGQRTLYYRWDGRAFAAASEIHALLQDAAVPLAADEARIRDFLVPLNMYRNEREREDTFYAGVRSLLPGHVLIVDDSGLTRRPYHELTPGGEIRYRTAGDYADHFLALFSEAVRCRLRAAHPMGAMLSGGLDSSSIVATAMHLAATGRVAAPPLTAYSLVYDGLECDERPLIQDLQDRYGFPVRYVSPDGYYRWLETEPAGFRVSPTTGLTERDALYRLAAGQGVRVLLSGDVADATVRGSLLVFASLLKRGRLAAFGRYFGAYRALTDESLLKSLLLHCLIPLLPRRAQLPAMRAYIRRYVGLERWRLLPFWMPQPLRDALSDRHLQVALEVEAGRRFADETRHQIHAGITPAETPFNPLGWPLENWRPFADRRLHEFLLAIPPEVLYVPRRDPTEVYGASKALLRQAMRGILPERIRTRTGATHFAALFAQDLSRRRPLYAATFGPGSRSEIAARGYVDAPRFWQRLEAIRGGAVGGDFVYVMRLVGLESWFLTFRLPRAAQTTFPSLWPQGVRPPPAVVAA